MNYKQLEIDSALWVDLIADLRHRGGGRRESGAFLLGFIDGEIRRVKSWVPYDELDSNALALDHVRLGTAAFTALWARCSQCGQVVVADVHTHPSDPRQSLSDRANPMIACSGHIALIIPNFAEGPTIPSALSVNVYLGSNQWSSHYGGDADARMRLL